MKSSESARKVGRKSDGSEGLARESSEQKYRAGPGRPPKEFQFRPGQSGNPKGAKRKPPSIVPDLKEVLERTLRGKITLRQGTKEKVVTLAEAGIKQLVTQFAKGDRHARRDLISLAKELGVHLAAGQADAIQQALAGELPASDQALLSDYVRRHRDEHDLGRDRVDTDIESDPKDSKPPP